MLLLKIVNCPVPCKLTQNASSTIFTNIRKSDYLIVKTKLNVKGFTLTEFFFQSVLIALNDDKDGFG
jgi:hypothetical protein